MFPYRGGPWINRRSEATGEVIERLSVDALLDETGTHNPLSPITIAGSASQPVLMVFAKALDPGQGFLTAIDLGSRTLSWKVEVSADSGKYALGQFPILMRAGKPRVVFTTFGGGARAVGTDPSGQE